VTAGPSRILVVGATGTVGRHLCRDLADAGHRVSAAARSLGFDWYDPASWTDALAGVDRMYLIAPGGDADPLRAMQPFLERARASGVTRAVLQSSSSIPPGSPGLGLVAAAVEQMFPQWAVLRPSWFMQNVTGDHVQATALRERGELVSATGSGRVGFIDARDIARVGAAALTGATAPNDDPILTGPRALSYDDVAAIIGRAAGAGVRHVDIAADRLRAHFERAGMSPEYASMLAQLDSAIAAGAEDSVTGEVHRLTGTAPRSFEEFAAGVDWQIRV
jgi:uncharacterized protein YbjT (DUF2867 family)